MKHTCMKMILKVRLSRESILKIIAKASLAVLVVAGVFGTPTVHAFRNYSEYAAACRAEGGTPSPSPARCEMPSARGGSTPAPSHDYGAAQRAQEAEAAAAAERQRQAEAERIERERRAEEKRQKDAAFIRDRDAAVNTLKGSSGGGDAMSQLKGLSGADSSSLRGSGFDTAGSGLKELKGSSPPNTTYPSRNESTSNEGSHTVSKSKVVCRPSQDPSVVDLCFLGDKPAVLDPQILKGMSPAERAALKTSAKNMTENLLPFDKEIFQALADMTGAAPAKTGKPWPGPNNPGTRYLNPLSEPEKVKAYWVKVNAGLQTHAEAQAKIVTANPKSMDWRDLVARQDADPKFRQSKEQIIRNQDLAEGQARRQMFTKFTNFLEKQGGTEWPDRIKNDKLFAARMVMEREALFKKMDQEIYGVRGKALQQMTVLVKEWKDLAPGQLPEMTLSGSGK